VSFQGLSFLFFSKFYQTIEMQFCQFLRCCLIMYTSRAHWLLARLTLNEQNLKPETLSMIHKCLTHDKFLECDKQLFNEFVLLFHNSVYHILKTCHTSKNLWIIDNVAGFKFCSLRVSLAKSQWARLVIFHRRSFFPSFSP